MKTVIGFFVRRPLLVNLLMLFAMIAGFLAIGSQEFNTYPSLDAGAVTISTRRPGASSEDIELSVTLPIEEEILKVDGLDKVISNSFENMSSILVRMDPDNSWDENDKVENDLQRALDRAASRLPDDLPQKPQMARHLSDRLPVLELFVSGSVPEETLRKTAKQLQNALREVQGIGGVDLKGYRKKEVRILLDANRMHQLKMSFNEIATAIKRRNVRDSGGALESFLSEKDVLVVGQFEDPKEVANVIIRSNGAGNYVRIRDIAKVVYGYEDWTVQRIPNGEFGINLSPRKKSDADGLTVADNIRIFKAEVEPSLPPGVKLTIVNDMSRFTRNMLDILTGNALVGMVLVFLVLLCFFPLRFTFWVTLGMPVAILIAFALMPTMDLEISQLSMGSVILMLGLLVDDAIITSESIFRRAESGDSATNAAINGACDVAPPVITSASTTLLAFAPAAFLGGIEGKFMWVVPATAMLCIVGSLLESQTMLPSHMCHSIKHRKSSSTAMSRRWFQSIENLYHSIMLWILPHRYKAAIVFLGVFGLIILWGVNKVNLELYPDVAVDSFYVQAELPIGSSFDNTREKLSQLESTIKALIPQDDLLDTTITVGHHDYDPKQITSGYHSSWGMIGVYLKPLGERNTDVVKTMDALRERFKLFSEYSSIIVVPQRETPPTGSAVELNIIGNHADRHQLVDTLSSYLRKHPATTEVWTSYTPGKDIIKLKLNHEAIADFGLQVADITQAVRTVFDGYIIDELQTADERIDYRLQFDRPDQGNIDALRSLTLINQQGVSVALRRLVDFEVHPGEANIKHYFGDRTTTIYAEIDRDKTSTAQINHELANFIAEKQLAQKHTHLRIVQGGEYVAQSEAIANVSNAFSLCLVGILFLLVLLFNSLSQPLLVMCVIPLGFTGVVFAFASHNIPLTMSGLIGMLGLTGVLVNDSLVMIDRMNREKQDSKDHLNNQQIVKCACLRLRPIFITTLTTVAGLFPAAYGLVGSNPFITPMIMAMLWGVLFGSFVTLFYLPCIYAMEQDLRRLLVVRLKRKKNYTTS